MIAIPGAGPIIFGEGCIVQETAVILNKGKAAMVIGSFNHFETGCRASFSLSLFGLPMPLTDRVQLYI